MKMRKPLYDPDRPDRYVVSYRDKASFGDWVLAAFLGLVFLVLISIILLVGVFAVFLTIRLIGMMP